MATCKDCIHFELCGTMNLPIYPDNIDRVEELCRCFKNKTDFVEKSLFAELKALIDEVKIGSDNLDAEYGAKYAKNQIAHLVSEFIRIKIDGERKDT